jgi:hypothetical protein
MPHLENVWECSCGYFLNCFLLKKIFKKYFFIFKKLFLTLLYQNDQKILKKY